MRWHASYHRTAYTTCIHVDPTLDGKLRRRLGSLVSSWNVSSETQASLCSVKIPNHTENLSVANC